MIRVLGFAFALAVIGCAGQDGGTEISDTPWTTAVDSTGDTVQVRIAGEIPAELTRTIVPEFSVGASDGDETVTFGRVGFVLGMPNGGMLVHDVHQASGLVRLYDSTGAYVRTIGAKGGGPGEYNQLNGITRLPNGEIVFWDATGGRLNRYTATGDYIGTMRMPLSSWFTQNALHSDRNGGIWAWTVFQREDQTAGVRARYGMIHLDTLGTVLDSLPYPQWSDRPAEFLTATGSDGRSMTRTSVPFTPGEFHRFNLDGGLVSGPGDPYVFYILPPASKPIRVQRDYTPVPVSDLESSQRRVQIEQTMRRLQPSWTWTGPSVPATKPAYSSIDVGEDGRLWVRVAQPGESIPEAELPPLRTDVVPTPIRFTTREPVAYDVYTPDGRLLGRVKLPWRTSIYRMRGNTVWGVRRDLDDVDYATRFRIEPGFPE